MASSKVCFGGGFTGFFLILPRPSANIGFIGSGFGGMIGMTFLVGGHVHVNLRVLFLSILCSESHDGGVGGALHTHLPLSQPTNSHTSHRVGFSHLVRQVLIMIIIFPYIYVS